MTQITTRPNSTIYTDGYWTAWPLPGTQTLHGNTADQVLTNWIQSDSRAYPSWSALCTLGFTVPSIPSGARPISLRLRVHAQRQSSDIDEDMHWLRASVSGIDVGQFEVVNNASWYLWTFPIQPNYPPSPTWAVDLYAYGQQLGPDVDQVIVTGLYLDTFVCQKPLVSAITAPLTGSTLTTSNIPIVTWTQWSDAVAGATGINQFEVKIVDKATWNAGGSVDAMVAVDGSGVRATAATGGGSWQGTINLPNVSSPNHYRVYVRVAVSVQGSPLWSDWVYSEFLVNVPLPHVPTFYGAGPDATAMTDSNIESVQFGRIFLRIGANAAGGGEVSTDWIEAQRTADRRATWTPVRAPYGGVKFPWFLTDFEAPQGVALDYRCRSVHDYGGLLAYSAWVYPPAGCQWPSPTSSQAGSPKAWLKHPTKPNLNLPVELISPVSGGVKNEARQSVFQPVGADRPVVVSDTRGQTGSTLRLLTDKATGPYVIGQPIGGDFSALPARYLRYYVAGSSRAALARLMAEGSPLLLQFPPSFDESDRWIVPVGWSSTRAVERAGIPEKYEEIEWIEIERPGDPLATSPYKATVLADVPIVYYRMEQLVPDSPVPDHSGNSPARDGSVSDYVRGWPSAILPEMGDADTGVAYGGAGWMPTTWTGWHPTTALPRTFESWIITGPSVRLRYAHHTAIFGGLTTTEPRCYVPYNTADVKFRPRGTGTANEVTWTNAVPLNEYFLVHLAFDGTTAELWVNCVSQGQKTPGAGWATAASFLQLGYCTEFTSLAPGGGTMMSEGVQDEFAIYDKILSVAQMRKRWVASGRTP